MAQRYIAQTTHHDFPSSRFLCDSYGISLLMVCSLVSRGRFGGEGGLSRRGGSLEHGIFIKYFRIFVESCIRMSEEDMRGGGILVLSPLRLLSTM